jgi:hypothetical protein
LFIKYFQEHLYEGTNEQNLDIADEFSKKGLRQHVFDRASNLREKAIEEDVPHHILGKELKEKTILEQVEELKNQTSQTLKDEKQLLEDIYSQKFTFEFLDKYAPKNLIMGLYTDCCATITSSFYGEIIAEKTAIAKDVQNLIVKNASGDIIGKGAMYVNQDLGYAIFNEFEIAREYKVGEDAGSGRYHSSADTQVYKDRELIFNALMRGIHAFVEEYDKENPSKPIQKVNVGMGFNRLKLQCERYEKETKNLEVPAEYSFNDTLAEQRVLYVRDEAKEKVI